MGTKISDIYDFFDLVSIFNLSNEQFFSIDDLQVHIRRVIRDCTKYLLLDCDNYPIKKQVILYLYYYNYYIYNNYPEFSETFILDYDLMNDINHFENNASIFEHLKKYPYIISTLFYQYINITNIFDIN